VDIILCRDFNINYLNDNQDKQALNSLLTSYSLYSITDFPTRIFSNSQTMIEAIFINKFKNENYLVSPDQRLIRPWSSSPWLIQYYYSKWH